MAVYKFLVQSGVQLSRSVNLATNFIRRELGTNDDYKAVEMDPYAADGLIARPEHTDLEQGSFGLSWEIEDVVIENVRHRRLHSVFTPSWPGGTDEIDRIVLDVVYEPNVEIAADGWPVGTTINESHSASLTITGTFNLYAYVDAQLGLNWPENYPNHDPYGVTNSALRFNYELVPGTYVHYHFVGGGETFDISVPADNVIDTFNGGLGWCRVQVDESFRVCTPRRTGITVPSTELLAGSFGGTGIDSASSEAAGSLMANYNPYDAESGIATLSLDSGQFSADWTYNYVGDQAFHSFGRNISAAMLRGPFDVAYTATAPNLDGTTRNAYIETIEHHDYGELPEWPPQDRCMLVPTDGTQTVYSSRGQAEVSFHSAVELVLDFYGASRDFGSTNLPSSTTHGTLAEGKTKENSRFGLIDLDELGEPAFPCTYHEEPCTDWFDDSRAPVTLPDISMLNWNDCLTFNVLDQCILANTAELSNWTVESGQCNISVENGKLVVEITSGPCTISHSVDAWITGARLIEWNYTADDTDAITVRATSGTVTHEWDILPDKLLTDVIAPRSRNGADATQTDIKSGAWIAGIDHVSEIKLCNLRAGKTYRFGTIFGKRPATGRFLRVEILNEAFIGYEPFTNWPSYDPYVGWDRGIRVIVDGVVACVGDMWSVIDSEWLYPDVLNNRIGLLIAALGPEDGKWKQRGMVDVYHLVTGIYTGDSSVTVPASYKTDTVMFPVCWGGIGLSIRKQLRGGIDVLVANSDGPPKPTNIIVQHKRTPDGEVLSELQVTTNNLGFASVGSLQQPIWDFSAGGPLGNCYTVRVQNKDGQWVNATVETRNRNNSTVCIVTGLPQTQAQGGLCGDVEPAGRIYRAYSVDGTIVVQHSDDGGTTWLPESPHAATSGTEPILSATWAGRYQVLILCYYDPETGMLAKRTSTDEGTTWSDAMNLCQGSHPFICRDDATDFRLLFYINGGKLWVRRSDDSFANWLKPDGTRVSITPIKSDAEVASEVAADAAEDTVYAEWTGSADHRVMLVYRNTSDQLVTVFSTANGLPPYE